MVSAKYLRECHPDTEMLPLESLWLVASRKMLEGAFNAASQLAHSVKQIRMHVAKNVQPKRALFAWRDDVTVFMQDTPSNCCKDRDGGRLRVHGIQEGIKGLRL